MKLSIACLAAAAALFALLPPAQAQSWQRSGMKQGYYAAYTGNADGARLRIDCGQSDEILSITYIPGRAPASARSAAGAIVIDGRRFAGSFEVAGDEIKVGADDLELARVRQGRGRAHAQRPLAHHRAAAASPARQLRLEWGGASARTLPLGFARRRALRQPARPALRAA